MKFLFAFVVLCCSLRAERVIFQHYGDVGTGAASRGVTIFFIPQAGWSAPNDGGYTVAHIQAAGAPFDISLPPGAYNYTFIPTASNGESLVGGVEATGTFYVVNDATLVYSLTVVNQGSTPTVGIGFANYAVEDSTSRAMLYLCLMAGFMVGWVLLSPLEVL